MIINEDVDTTILTNNNLSVLSMLKEYPVISDVDSLRSINDRFVVFNDVIRYLKDKDKQILFKKLKESGTHYINITSDIEEVLFTHHLMVIENGKIIIDGSTESVLKEEKILKRLGYGLPFIVDLSIQLNHYDLVDSMYLDEEVLVNKLW